MNDRFARRLASVSLAIAAIAIIVALYALSVVQQRGEEIHALTQAMEQILLSQRSGEVGLHAPPPALDPGD